MIYTENMSLKATDNEVALQSSGFCSWSWDFCITAVYALEFFNMLKQHSSYRFLGFDV